MNPNRLALIVAYYLARFDTEGVKNLGFSTMRQAFQEISSKLKVNENYIKLRRDEFDRIFPWRRGWQAPMSRQILKTIEAFQDLTEKDLRTVVANILNDKQYSEGDEIEQIANVLNESIKKPSSRKGIFVIRNPTGRKAEEFFIQQHKIHGLPFPGELKDTRDLGCGYDFEILFKNETYRIEVKGVSEAVGGIVFTDKEWQTANKFGDKYYMVIVSSLNDMARITYVKNPVSVLTPKKNLYSTIQVQWSVHHSQLIDFLEPK